jgi:hypothetical protein
LERQPAVPCIFGKGEKDLTDEHVFPAFIGGTLTVKNGSCRKCNAEASKFEDKVAGQTKIARHIFEVPNRYGQVPSAPVKVEIPETGLAPITGRRQPDGEIQLQDFVASVKTDDVKKVREGFFITQENAEKFIEKSRSRGEKVTELDVPKEVTLLSSGQQVIDFAFSPDMRRMVAKIALVATAYQYGTEYACLPQFDALRRAIFAGTGYDLPMRIFANKDFVSDYIRTPHQHSVRSYFSAGMHKGWAIVTLFGGLSYVIELTGQFNEVSSRNFSLFFDAASRKTFNPVVLYSEQEVIGRVLSPDTVFEQPEAIDAQWYPIVEQFCKENGIELSRIAAAPATPSPNTATPA